jgi:pyruvyl transferase EpsO
MSEPVARDAVTAAILVDLRSRIRTAIDAAVPAGATVGLLNFPNHRNAGDSAIWLAGEELLRTRPATIAYRCAWNTLDPAAFGRAVPDGPAVLNGGGNFGDLYPGGQQALRERVLETMTGRPIIQLPQSIHFQDPANLDRLRRLVARHGQVTILCRDDASLAIAETFEATVAFCPDLAFTIGPFGRPAAPEVDIVWLARTDPERKFAPPDDLPADVRVIDWLEPVAGEPPWPAGRRREYQMSVRFVAGATARQPAFVARAATRTFAPLARAWVDRGVALLAHGRVVVTDRLHAHVLAFLTGIPSVVLDNTYGKVHGVIRTTTIDSPLTHLASSVPEALELARHLVAEQQVGDA